MLATLHRDSNTDSSERLNAILDAFKELSKEITVVLPMHPRTRKKATDFHADNVIVTEPVSFLEMIQLEKHAQLVLTDSGGVQKESYFFKKLCVILRPETEWVEIVETGAATLADADKEKILEASHLYLQQPPINFPEVFGDGHAEAVPTIAKLAGLYKAEYTTQGVTLNNYICGYDNGGTYRAIKP